MEQLQLPGQHMPSTGVQRLLPTLTSAQVAQKDIKEGDADGLVVPAVLLNLSQDQLRDGVRLSPGALGPSPLTHRRAAAGRDQKAAPWYRGQLDGPKTQSPSTAGSPQAHLDAASQDAGRQLLVEAGVLLTVNHQVEQGWCQRRGSVVLVQGFGQSLAGARTAHHHRTVLAGGGQAV